MRQFPPGKLLGVVEAFGARAITQAVHESGKHRRNNCGREQKGSGRVK